MISATLDVVGGIAALFSAVGIRMPESEQEALGLFSNMGTIDLRVDYLRPGTGSSFKATSTVLRTGRRVVVTRMELRNSEDTLLAVGTGTYIVG